MIHKIASRNVIRIGHTTAKVVFWLGQILTCLVKKKNTYNCLDFQSFNTKLYSFQNPSLKFILLPQTFACISHDIRFFLIHSPQDFLK